MDKTSKLVHLQSDHFTGSRQLFQPPLLKAWKAEAVIPIPTETYPIWHFAYQYAVRFSGRVITSCLIASLQVSHLH